METSYLSKEEILTAGRLFAQLITRDIEHCHRFTLRWAQLHWYPSITIEGLLRGLYQCLQRVDHAIVISGKVPSLVLYGNSTCTLPVERLTNHEVELLSVGLRESTTKDRIGTVFTKSFYRSLNFEKLILSVLCVIEKTLLVTHRGI
jgi:hypothetical protein